MRQHAMLQLGFIGGSDSALPVPSGSSLGDALSAVAACAHAATTSYDLHAPRGAPSYSRCSREELGRRFLGLMAYSRSER
jgi:hypothetical protein